LIAPTADVSALRGFFTIPIISSIRMIVHTADVSALYKYQVIRMIL
jgi:hypothetical protein